MMSVRNVSSSMPRSAATVEIVRVMGVMMTPPKSNTTASIWFATGPP